VKTHEAWWATNKNRIKGVLLGHPIRYSKASLGRRT